MKTNFKRTIKTKMDAVKFIKELQDNDELFHFDDPVEECFEGRATDEELEDLDALVDICFDILPCPHLVCCMVHNREPEVYERYISIHKNALNEEL